MRDFDPSIIIELAKEGFSFFLLLSMELVSGTVRYTDADIDIWYEGNKYDSADFIFDQIETSGNLGVDQVSVTFNNANLAMGAVVLSEDIMGRSFTLSFLITMQGSGRLLTETSTAILLEGGLLDGQAALKEVDAYIAGYSVVGAHDLFYGLISDWELSEPSVWLEIQNELVFWAKRSLRKCDSSCPWEFSTGVECGYSGSETWCDQSYERCVALGNKNNFGGHRFLPAISEKDIWWGRAPS